MWLFSEKGKMSLKTILSLVGLLLVSSETAASKYNMTRGVTPLSHAMYSLHMIVFWICVGIGVVVFGVLFYSLYAHRKSKGHKAAEFHEHPVLEILWAVIPLVILVVMAIPATKVVLDLEDSSKADITIKITGFQWKWKYEYLDQGIQYFSNLSTPQAQIHNKEKKGKWYLLEVDHPLVLPINKKIRFLITSNDVIHSWWVPDLGVKKDAVPGFIHEAWARIEKVGTYRGQCAELCGANHAFMPIVVEATTEQEFKKWVSKKTGVKVKAGVVVAHELTKEELMKQGETVYKAHCAVCHKPDGIGMPPAFPALKGGKVATGPVSKHIETVLHGVEGTAMVAFSAQLSDVDLSAVITYERNSWGNADSKYGKNAGGLVQPADVKKARGNN